MRKSLLLLGFLVSLFGLKANIHKSYTFDCAKLDIRTIVKENEQSFPIEDAAVINDDKNESAEEEPLNKSKIKSTAKPFLVEGKTWWYTNTQRAVCHIDEFGIRIGSPVTLDAYGEEIWFPVNGILERKFVRKAVGVTDGNWSEFNDRIIIFAWMSEKDNKIFTLINPESSKLRYDGIAISPYTSDTPFQVYDFGEIGHYCPLKMDGVKN